MDVFLYIYLVINKIHCRYGKWYYDSFSQRMAGGKRDGGRSEGQPADASWGCGADQQDAQFDVVFGEDSRLKRVKNSAENFNIVRKIVLGLLKNDGIDYERRKSRSNVGCCSPLTTRNISKVCWKDCNAGLAPNHKHLIVNECGFLLLFLPKERAKSCFRTNSGWKKTDFLFNRHRCKKLAYSCGCRVKKNRSQTEAVFYC